jgi:CcmD family protein
MTRLTALLGMMLLACGLATTVFAQTPGPGGTLQQEGFTPIDQLPPQDQLPAAPLLIAAYVFVVVVLFAYLFSVARRLGAVQQQVARLEGDMQRNKKA